MPSMDSGRRRAWVAAFFVGLLGACASGPTAAELFGTTRVPGAEPLLFEPARASSGLLIHGGCFSPDLTEFLFTVSDAEFQRFDVMLIR
ncbi:MAG: hypothetical protein ACI9HE_004235, partial [Planctomycetota bacterium]